MVGSRTGFQHNVIASPADLRCIRDCTPRRALLRGRAFEIAAEEYVPDDDADEHPPGTCPPPPPDEPDTPRLRLAEPVSHDSPFVFQYLTMRFAIYQGCEPSERDMTFGFRVSGGFRPLSASLLTVGGTTAVSPQSLVYVPQLASLAVADGAQKGLTFVALDRVSVSHMFY